MIYLAATSPKTRNFLKDCNPHYREGVLVIHEGKAGTIHELDFENDKAIFKPFILQSRPTVFYQHYITVRDNYFLLSEKESRAHVADDILRRKLNESYDLFYSKYGCLNSTANRNPIFNDALGFITLSSLEINLNENFIKADIFHQPVFPAKKTFTTDNPAEALAHCLNEKGKVDIEFIAQITGKEATRVIDALHSHIYLNPRYTELGNDRSVSRR